MIGSLVYALMIFGKSRRESFGSCKRRLIGEKQAVGVTSRKSFIFMALGGGSFENDSTEGVIHMRSIFVASILIYGAPGPGFRETFFRHNFHFNIRVT